MRKQYFVNEEPVESITAILARKDGSSLQWIKTPPKAQTPLMLKRAMAINPERYRITKISEIPVDGLSFTAEFRDDGAHIFIPALVSELGKLSGRTYQDWATSRSAQPARAEKQQSKPFYFTGETLITITEDGLLNEWSEASDEIKAIVMMILSSNRLQSHENPKYKTSADKKIISLAAFQKVASR